MGILDQLFAQQGYGLFGGNYPSTIFHQPEEAQAAREAAAQSLARSFRRRKPEDQPQAPSIFDTGGAAASAMPGQGLYGLNPGALAPSQPPMLATIPQQAAPVAPSPAPPAPVQDGPSGYMQIGDYSMPQFGPRELYQPQQAQLPQNAQPAQGQLPQQATLPPALSAPTSGGLGGAFSGFARNAHTGPIGALIGAVGGGLGMTDPDRDIARQNLRAQFEAYKAAGLTESQAMLAVMNPKLGEALMTPKYEKVGPGENLVSVGGAGGVGRTVASGGPEKPPSGFEWVDKSDPSKGMRGIPGSPATQLPSETAGRLALMKTAVADLPKAREALLKGRGDTGTGVSGAAASYTNIGETGRAQRTVRTAIEGVLRAMTGAAAPESEVSRYEGMFMPGPFDSAATATQKLNQLDDFISNAERLINQGRGPAASPGGRTSDPLGIR